MTTPAHLLAAALLTARAAAASQTPEIFRDADLKLGEQLLAEHP